ncbi:hypothetical protein AGLY_015515, partial [Aphis glycines]
MQNQLIPKLSVTEVFYSKQVWVYNLTFVLTTEKQILQNCHIYTWTEIESERGPNEKIFSEINHYFSFRRHSYMPPDQVFGRIVQELNKIETIISLSEYYKIFQKHITVNVYGENFNVCDYKSAAKKVSNLKGKNTVGISKTDEGEVTRVSVIKRFRNLQEISQLAKKEDFIKLNNFFKIPVDAEKFYNDIFQNVNNNNIENDEGLAESERCKK